MKALLVTPDHRLTISDVAKPDCGPCEALVRIKACGICSTTDTNIVRGQMPFVKEYPCILGHEAIGEVIEVGAHVRKFKTGDFVTRPMALGLDEVRDGVASGWGGFAEYGLVKDREALLASGKGISPGEDHVSLRQNVVPKETSLAEAVLGISLAETSSWFSHLPNIWGKTICVAGTGVAGLSLALWGKLAGAKKVIVLGRRKERLDLAINLAADTGINIKDGFVEEKIRDLTEGTGVDFFLEASGSREQLLTGMSVLAPGGTMAVYGSAPDDAYDFDWSRMPGFSQVAKFPAEEHKTYSWVIDLMKRRVIPAEKMMTHRFSLEDYQQAFDAIWAGTVVKAYLEW
ncbi:MAG: zinc-binding dehydrogenase [Spirochaetia bacterium]|nr:zinc-binding dehydrogenase [Spirochaetia bacterium]